MKKGLILTLALLFLASVTVFAGGQGETEDSGNLKLVLLVQGMRQIKQRTRISWIEVNRPAPRFDRGVESPQRGESGTKVVMGPCVLWIECDSFLPALDRLFDLLLPVKNDAEIVVGGG